MAARPGLTRSDRPRFIGFKGLDRGRRLRAGEHFIPAGHSESAENDQGFMSSVAFSPELNHWIGLGFLKDGPDRIGERLVAADPLHGESIEVEVFLLPTFVDPGEERLRV